MVRSVTSGGREGGGGVTFIPGMVNKHTVKANKSRNSTLVGPSVQPIPNGEFNEAQVVDRIVKEFCFRGREIVIIAVCGVAG
jgi:hypothetical protein